MQAEHVHIVTSAVTAENRVIEILHEQMELLAAASKNPCVGMELTEITHSMKEISEILINYHLKKESTGKWTN